MTALSNLLSKPSSEKNLRPFDVRRDSSAVADLVELCFADTLDADGRRYLHHMRTTGNTAGILRWTRLTTGLSGTPLAGYVWEQDGEIVGNASLIPYFVRGKRTYLIANVAVHPDFRRRGIARKLTRRLVKGLRAREAIQVWLHVRHDNIAAFDLYRSEGFIERTRRTTWITRRGINLEEPAVEARSFISTQRRLGETKPLARARLPGSIFLASVDGHQFVTSRVLRGFLASDQQCAYRPV